MAFGDGTHSHRCFFVARLTRIHRSGRAWRGGLVRGLYFTCRRVAAVGMDAACGRGADGRVACALLRGMPRGHCFQSHLLSDA